MCGNCDIVWMSFHPKGYGKALYAICLNYKGILCCTLYSIPIELTLWPTVKRQTSK